MKIRHFLWLLALTGLAAQQTADPLAGIDIWHVKKHLDWAQLNHYEAANQQIIDTESFPDVVFMGNSITEGWSAFFPNFFEENNFVNRGIGGQTTPQMLVRFRRDVIALKPKAVVILAGINDIARNTPFEDLHTVAGHIFGMAEMAQASGIVPVMASTLPADRFPWNPEVLPAPMVVELNTILKAYAEENHFPYLDYYSAMDNGKGGLQAQLTTDSVHLTKAGYKQMMKMVLEVTKDLL